MRILLDEQLPSELAPEFDGHDVRTVHQQGWDGLRNGELLRRAVLAGFEIFVTADKSLQFQQNLGRLPLAVIVLRVPNLRRDSILSLAPRIRDAIPNARRGEALRVGP